MKNVVDDLKVNISETNGIVEWDELPIVMGDKIHITRVLQNLVSNALKFHNENTPQIIITGQAKNGKCEISVSDNGIGIEEEFFHQIFVPFKRLHGISKYEGSGIGLAICQKIVVCHGGELRVESKPGVGSTFMFSLKNGAN